MAEHEYNLSESRPQVHRFDRQAGNQVFCSMPDHHEMITVTPGYVLTKKEDGTFDIVNGIA